MAISRNPSNNKNNYQEQVSSMRLINLFLVLGIVLITEVFPSDVVRRHLVTLLAAWSILHTYQVQRTQNWRFDFIALSSRTVKLFQCMMTVILVIAALCMWLLPIRNFPTTTSEIVLISSGIMFLKLVLTPA